MSKWQKVKLGELYDVHNGLSKSRDAFGSGYPFLSFSEVFNNYFLPDELKQLVETTPQEQESYSIHRGDVFITRTSETMDELGMSCVALQDYPKATYNGFTKRLRPKNQGSILPEYVGYFLRTPLFRSKFVAFSTMTTRASLRNEDLLAMEISLPPIEVQRKIADILSAYDDLIENNRKQIRLLEEAAQRLYKEWFIDLRFPGHETTKIINGIPDGWEKKRLNEVIGYEIGGGWGSDVPTNTEDQPGYVIRGTDINGITNGNISMIPFRYHAKNNLSARILKHGDIIFEVSGGSRMEGVGKTLLLTEQLLSYYDAPVICASFCKLIRLSKLELSYYLGTALKYWRTIGRIGEFEKKSASSIINYRWKDFLTQQQILIPSKNVMSHYNQIAGATYNKIIALALMTEKAQQTRNRLLPKLMNGELEVK